MGQNWARGQETTTQTSVEPLKVRFYGEESTWRCCRPAKLTWASGLEALRTPELDMAKLKTFGRRRDEGLKQHMDPNKRLTFTSQQHSPVRHQNQETGSHD